MNYYPFNMGDYAAHTGHLEPMEDLAYRRLLDQYYLREGALPADIEATAKLVRMRSMKADVEAVLREFFVLTEHGWSHGRCDSEIERMQDKQAKARASAQASVNARKAKSLSAGSADAKEISSGRSAFAVEKHANAQLPTPTPTPINSVPNGTDGKPSEKPTDRDMIFANGVALLTVAGVAEKNARSMLAGLAKTHGDAAVASALGECAKANPVQPVSWLQAFLSPKAKPGKHAGFEKLDYREGVSKDGSLA